MPENSTDFFHSAACGFAAGGFVGAGCSIPEYLKVKVQTDKNIKMKSLLNANFWHQNWKSLAATAPVFGTYVGLVCAVEFSINGLVAENWGPYAGLMASATTAAFFLTPADQFMLRKDKEINYRDSWRHFSGARLSYAFTGFTPMFWREWLFGLSVLYLGPKLGEHLKQYSDAKNKEQSDLIFRFLGTLLTSIITTTLSHPFDSFTRKMHMMTYANKYTAHPRLRDVAFTLGIKELYCGFPFRLGIAGIGGASIGTLYKFFKEINVRENTQTEQHEMRHSKSLEK